MLDVFVAKECHQFISSIAIVLVVWNKGHLQVFVVAIGILLKGRTDKANFEVWGFFHQDLNQLGSTIARHDIRLAHAKALAGDEGVDLHARGIFRQQGVEVSTELVLHALTGEVGVHQIAEIEHLRETPEATIASIVLAQHILLVSKQCLGNVEVLLVVNLVPFLIADRQRLHVVVVQQRDDAQHVLVVLVVTHRLSVGFEEGHVFLLRELA